MKPSLLPGLTGLRGIGALWVVLYHIQFGIGLPFAEVGYLGVDLFFILSGFVLSHAHFSIRWCRATYFEFLQARFARIFPLHWTCLLLTVLIIQFFPEIRASMPNKFRWDDLLSSILLVQNWGFGRVVPWNVPSWSLSTEWLMSIAFPLFLSIGRRIPAGLAAFLCAGCLLVFALFLNLTNNPVPDVTLRAGVIRTVCEFAAGCLLYRFYESGGQVNRLVKAVAILAFLFGVLLPSWSVVTIFSIPVLILLAAQPAGLIFNAVSIKTFQFLGEVSFSIYLTHWILLQVSDRIEAASQISGLLRVVWSGCFLVMIIGLSTLSYFGVEKPARAWLRPARRHR